MMRMRHPFLFLPLANPRASIPRLQRAASPPGPAASIAPWCV